MAEDMTSRNHHFHDTTHRRGPRRSLRVFGLALAMLASLLTASPAVAAPPTNDDIADAIVIPGAGFTDTRNTAEATYVSSDPDCGAATVWYSFTPATSGRFLFDTVGSSYDTMLAVLTGSPGELRMLECHDDDFESNERIVLDAVAGTTYYIQAGTCCGADSNGQVGPGGNLTLHASVAPPALNVRGGINRRGTINRFGAAVVRGSLVCNRSAEQAEVYVTVRQRQRSRVVTAEGFRSMRCQATRRKWTVVLENSHHTFRRGVAQVRLSAFACDDFTCDDLALRRVVKLRARR